MKKNRLLAFLLAVVMIVGILPVSAFAEEIGKEGDSAPAVVEVVEQIAEAPVPAEPEQVSPHVQEPATEEKPAAPSAETPAALAEEPKQEAPAVPAEEEKKDAPADPVEEPKQETPEEPAASSSAVPEKPLQLSPEKWTKDNFFVVTYINNELVMPTLPLVPVVLQNNTGRVSARAVVVDAAGICPVSAACRWQAALIPAEGAEPEWFDLAFDENNICTTWATAVPNGSVVRLEELNTLAVLGSADSFAGVWFRCVASPKQDLSAASQPYHFELPAAAKVPGENAEENNNNVDETGSAAETAELTETEKTEAAGAITPVEGFAFPQEPAAPTENEKFEESLQSAGEAEEESAAETGKTEPEESVENAEKEENAEENKEPASPEEKQTEKKGIVAEIFDVTKKLISSFANSETEDEMSSKASLSEESDAPDKPAAEAEDGASAEPTGEDAASETEIDTDAETEEPAAAAEEAVADESGIEVTSEEDSKTAEDEEETDGEKAEAEEDEEAKSEDSSGEEAEEKELLTLEEIKAEIEALPAAEDLSNLDEEQTEELKEKLADLQSALEALLEAELVSPEESEELMEKISLLEDTLADEEEPAPQEIVLTAAVDNIIITLAAEPGAFGDVASDEITLSVSRIEDGADRIEQAVAEKRDADVEVVSSYKFDITVLDSFGNELQPVDGASVKVSFAFAEAADEDLTVNVYHLKDRGDGNLSAETLAAEKQVAVGEASEETIVTVETDGFSEYVVEMTREPRKTLLSNANTTPLNLNDYADKSFALKHRHEGEDWQLVTPETQLTGDEELQINIFYNNIESLDLRAHGYQMTYDPGTYLDSVGMSGTIISGGIVIGTITVAEDGLAMVAFDPAWVEAQVKRDQDGKEVEGGVITGDFKMTAHLNLGKIEDDKPNEVSVGNVQVKVKDPADIVAEYGEIHVNKPNPTIRTVEISDGTFSHFLDYEVTVTAGKDGCPQVRVEDEITQNFEKVDFVDYRHAVDSSGATGNVTYDNSTRKMTWTVGDMAPNETRTLNYSVKMNEDFAGNKATGNVRNHVDLYSKDFPRDEDDADYNGKAAVNVTKSGSEVTEDADGNMLVSFTVVATAASNNPYELKNVHITDNFANRTEDKFEPYIHYNSDITVKQTGKETVIVDQPDDDATSFAVTVPVLKPGESVTITYSMQVDAEVAAVANEDLSLNNRAEAWDDSGARVTDGQSFSYRDKDTRMDSKRWVRKASAGKVTSPQTITASGELYDATSGTVVPMSAVSENFTVPKDSFKYTIVVNEDGGWNISDLNMTDTLTQTGGVNYLAYNGYVMVEAVDTNGAAIKTVWVKVDQMTSFSYTPAQIGLTDIPYELHLTYYAAPQNVADVIRVTAGNGFGVSGQVIGPDENPVILSNITQTASVTVTGGQDCQVTKESWYYDLNGTPDCPNGKIYWAIKIDSSTLQKDLIIQESANYGNSNHTLPTDKAVIGFYRMDLGGQRIDQVFKNVDELKTDPRAQEVNISEYCAVSYTDNKTDMNFTITKSLEMVGEESLYIILCTTPTQTLPDRYAHTFSNKLNLKYPGKSWMSDVTHDSITVDSGKGIVKENGYFFTMKADGTMEKPVGLSVPPAYDEGKLGKTFLNNNNMSGVFVSWGLKINVEGVLGGDGYLVVDDFPEGLVPVYARLKWFGPSYNNANHPRLVQISDPGPGWQEGAITYGTDNGISEISYYYTNGRQLKFQIDGFIANNQWDAASIDLQVLAQVVDNEVLASNVQKTFRNNASIYNRDGNLINNATCPVTVKVPSIRKDGTYPANNGGKYPFKLLMNQGADDLVPNADTITVVDEMGGSLTLLSDSVKVINNANNTRLAESDYVVSVESKTAENKTILKVTVPDSMAVTIEYDCLINATPGQEVAISNAAHWEGKAADTTSSFTKDRFSYSAEGQAFSDTKPHIKLTKVDGKNTGTKLDGAKFEFAPVIMDPNAPNGYKVDPDESTHHFHITGADGDPTGMIMCYNLSGSHTESGSEPYEYNKVYAIREVQAPTGYMLNSEWTYWMVLKPINGQMPTVPQGVVPYINGYEFPMTAYNNKVSAVVNKVFPENSEPVSGTYTFGIWRASDVDAVTKDPQRSMFLPPVTINYPLTTQAEFYGLVPGESYYIYELNDSGTAIVPGQGMGAEAIVNGTPFIVSYTNAGNVTIPENISINDPKPSVTVMNREKASPVDVTFSGVKTLEGKHLEAGMFSFVLKDDDDQIIGTATNDENGNYTFSAITFTDPGVYPGESKFYKVVEQIPDDGIPGVTYSNVVYQISVTVTGAESDQLKASVSWSNGTSTGTSESDLNFTNTYHASPAKLTFSGKKTLTGKNLDASAFSFTLKDSKGTTVETVTNSGDGTFAFPALTFDKVGSYKYTVTEVKPENPLPGVEYDEREYQLNVTVIDNGEGQLVASLSGTTNDPTDLLFQNAYTASPIKLSLGGTKTLEGRDLEAEEFSFIIQGITDGHSETVKNGVDGKFTFSDLEFDAAGDYKYKVWEDNSTDTETDGITYASTVYEFTVHVTDNGSGQLQYALVGLNDAKALNFTNKYKAQSTSVTFGGYKQFSGFPKTDGLPQFTFTLTEKTVDGDYLRGQKSVTGSGNYAFEPISYESAGEYHYVVKEVNAGQSGVIYDTKEYSLTVNVTDDGTGQLQAIVTGDTKNNGKDLNFSNGYKAAPVEVALSGKKTLSNRDLIADEFSFTLEVSDGHKETVKNDANGLIRFETHEFKEAGVFTCTVKEEPTTEKGITIDSTVYNFTITVTDDGTGILSTKITKENGEPLAADGLNFNNTYKANSTSVAFGGTKNLSNFPADAAAPVFTFRLSEKIDGNYVEKEIKTVAGSGTNKFSSITYDQVGVHQYLIEEVAGDPNNGIIYDTKKYELKVTVTDDGSGQLHAAVTDLNDQPVADYASGLNFNNGYKASPVKLRLSGTKTLTGKRLREKEFSFTLTGSDGSNITVKNKADGTIDFGEREFKAAGTYNFTVKEDDTTEAGVTKDSRIYNFRVIVTDNGTGALSAKIEGDTTTASGLTFANTYKAKSTSVIFGGTKTFSGFPADSSIKPVFTFTLTENGTVIDTKTVERSGDYAFDSITYETAGEHTYVVQEVKGSQSGVTYDTKTYEINVDVTDDGSGVLKAAVTGANANGTGLNFTNSYTPKPVSVSLRGTKTLVGRDLKDGEFSFTVEPVGQTPEAFTKTVTNTADGTIDFGSHEFTKAGVYTYRVAEDAIKDNPGVSGDNTVYEIIITVTDSGNGALSYEISDGVDNTGTRLNFENNYSPTDTFITLGGTKTFTGFPAGTGIVPEFTFELYEGEDIAGEQPIRTQTVRMVGSEESYRFQNLSYNAEDKDKEFIYTIVEKVGNQAGVTYDSQKHVIKVLVKDNLSGQLVATITGDTKDNGKDLNFTNSYTPEPVEVSLSGSKILVGRELKDKEFSFTVSPDENNTHEAFTNRAWNDAKGNIDFGCHIFTEAGVYTYVVKEDPVDPQKNPGVTGSSKEYKITITVTDSGKGKLTYAISGDSQTGSDLKFENIYAAGSTSVTLSGKKIFDNFPEDSNIEPEFIFELYAGNGTAGKTPIDTQTVKKGGEYHFAPLTYADNTDEGNHVYTVVERKGSQSGVKYDEKAYVVNVNVADNGSGQLIATVTGDTQNGGKDLDFRNIYTPKPIAVSLSGTKTYVNTKTNTEIALEGGEFSFTVTGGKDGTEKTVTNEAGGKIDFGTHTFTETGVYTYEVKENATDKDGVSIDSKVYHFTVTVTDDGSGQLKAAIDGDTTTGSDVNFRNEYTPGSTSVVFGGTKTFEGLPENTGIASEFTFELSIFALSEEGVQLETQSVEGSGDYNFTTITFTEAGEHHYQVSEIRGSQKGVTYDPTVYDIYVSVVDDGIGHLVATVTDGKGNALDASALHFTNSYKAAPVEVQLLGTKELTGKTLAEVTPFSFTVTGKEEAYEETFTNDENGKIDFGRHTYTKAGVYTYEVKENATSEPGITIDDKIYNFTVTVTDDGRGQLKAAFTGDTTTGTDLHFSNAYEANSTSVIFGGTKTFTGFPAESAIRHEFAFALYEVADENESIEGKTPIQTVKREMGGDYQFGSITYHYEENFPKEGKDYYYKVAELEGDAKEQGVSYAENIYTVKVHVYDDGKGSLQHTVTGAGDSGTGLNFTNSYHAAPTELHLTGTKTLTGRDLAAEEFSFTITGGEDGASVTVSNDEDGRIDFGTHQFTKAGTYTYIVHENDPKEPGVTYDSTVYSFTVTVTDPGNGKLVAAITSGNLPGVANVDFANTYKYGTTSVVLGGTKHLSNFPADSAIKPVFTFTLSENGKVIDTQTVEKQGDYDFKAITYDKEGVHNYIISESAGSQGGITYDEETYELTVTVKDDKQGNLVATISGDSTTGQDLDFTNGYKAAPVSVSLSGKKTLEGRALADEEFTFILEGGADGITAEAQNDADGKIDFGSHEFTKPGVYTYTVKEKPLVQGENPGVTIDSKVYRITVTVTDPGNGRLEAAISGDTTTGKDLNFANKYEADSTSVILGGKKTFNDFPADSTIKPVFTFTLSENGTVIDTKTVTKEGDYDFNAITYTEPGVHNYVIAETRGNQHGVTYDENTYEVTVTVEDEGKGQLVATISGESTNGQDLNFVNGYKAAPVEVHLSGHKTLTDEKKTGKVLKADEFSFTITGEEEGIHRTFTNDGEGNIDFGSHKFTAPGLYHYSVKEEATDEAGVTIDSKIYHFTVNVTDSGNGRLEAAITGDTTTGTDVDFVNAYIPGSTYVELGGKKTFTGFPAESEIEPEFSFELSEFTLSEDGVVIDTDTVLRHGEYDFKSITYTEPGVHHYTVAETKGTQAGVTYDTKVYEITVTVEDNDGQLVASITGDSTTGKDLNFTNSYVAAPVDVHFTGMKTLEGNKTLEADQFHFTLSGSGVNETVGNAENGRISFSKITYTAPGTYTYTVKEEAVDKITDPGVTGDSKVYHITVTVTDSGNGQLKAEISGDTTTGNDLNFTNEYIAGSASVTFGGRKSFNGFPMDSSIVPMFEFTLSENGTVLDTQTVEKSGDYEFKPIIYTDNGVEENHTYIIRETKGNQKGVTYDTRIYTVYVNVKDNGEGQLITTISGDSPDGTDLNFINGYTASPVDIQLSGYKKLEGSAELKDYDFTFTLTGPDGKDIETVRNDPETGKITFTKLTFNAAGEYAYTVKEDHKNIPGITIDSKIYHFTVNVTDSGNGQLEAAISGDTTTGTNLNFVNTYVPNSTSVIFGGTKTFEGFPSDSKIVPAFTFELYEGEGYEGKTPIDTKTVEKEGEYDFNPITYTEGGTYTYTIRELEGDHEGITYDNKLYTVQVKVTDNKELGSLVAEISGASKTGEDFNFTNTYKAKPVDIRFSGLKTLDGRELAADEFSFILTRPDGTKETVRNTENGGIKFTEITLTEAGSYTFAVQEEEVDEKKDPGVTIDSKIYTIEVEVTDSGNGRLEAKLSGDTTVGSDLNFENKYVPASTSVILGGRKALTGFPENSTIKPVFTFTLSENGTVIDTKNVEKEGTYNFKTITYTEAGQHHYTVTETVGNQAGVTYDTKSYTVTVDVTDNRKGQLVAEIGGDTKTGDNLNFSNSYLANPTEVQFSGTKMLVGRDLEENEFSFTLSGSGVNETVKNDADGNIIFSKITYNKPGEYTYTVKENKLTQPGLTCDEKVYNITVTVEDPGNGQLEAKISGSTTSGTDLNFRNIFRSGSLAITKTVTGNLGNRNQPFTFTVTFNAPGAYPYTISGNRTGTISSGGKIQLKHGESVVITGLPEGVTYKVTESGNEGYRVYSTGETGVISSVIPARAAFTNTRSTVPMTGDNTKLLMWIGMMLSFFTGGAATMFFDRKKNRRYNRLH